MSARKAQTQRPKPGRSTRTDRKELGKFAPKKTNGRPRADLIRMDKIRVRGRRTTHRFFRTSNRTPGKGSVKVRKGTIRGSNDSGRRYLGFALDHAHSLHRTTLMCPALLEHNDRSVRTDSIADMPVIQE
eukprot:scaffold80_cov325-Pavlova_lutheri.AAC.59